MWGDMGRYGPPLAARRRLDWEMWGDVGRYGEIWATARGPSAPRCSLGTAPPIGRFCEGSGKVPRDAPMQSWYRPTSSVSAAKQRTVRIMPTCGGRDARDLGRLHLAADGAHHAHVMTPIPPEYQTQVCCARGLWFKTTRAPCRATQSTRPTRGRAQPGTAW